MIIAAKAGFVNLFGGKISPAEVSAGEMQYESSMMPLQTAGIKAAFFKAAIILCWTYHTEKQGKPEKKGY